MAKRRENALLFSRKFIAVVSRETASALGTKPLSTPA
jgi:hypothetical protein